MTYKELIDKQSQEANEWSHNKIFWIFGTSEEERNKQINELGLNPNDLKYIGAGGYILKEYEKEFIDLCNKQSKEKKEYLLANVYEVVNYTYWNYEAYISLSYDYDSILTDVLYMTKEEIEDNKEEIKRAKLDYIREFEELNI